MIDLAPTQPGGVIEPIDGEPVGDGGGGGLAVAGQHDDRNPCSVQTEDRLGRGVFDRVGDAKQAARLGAGEDGHGKRVLARALQAGGEALDGRPRALRLAHHPHDLREQGVGVILDGEARARGDLLMLRDALPAR